jgi:hypothetical protein
MVLERNQGQDKLDLMEWGVVDLAAPGSQAQLLVEKLSPEAQDNRRIVLG